MEKNFKFYRTDREVNTFVEALFSKPLIFDVPEILVLFVVPDLDGEESRTLLKKMILAMKLHPKEFSVLEDLGQDTWGQISRHCPSVVASFGAKATSFLLGEQERISKVHGNFFPRQMANDVYTQIVPLFHPNFLLINPSMKKSVWMDMQKIMDFVGKSPA